LDPGAISSPEWALTPQSANSGPGKQLKAMNPGKKTVLGVQEIRSVVRGGSFRHAVRKAN
jgi:hypothetical protein